MSEPISELVEISRLNGDFKRNYGKLIGAFLYLRSISAARASFFFGAFLCLRSFRPPRLGWRGTADSG